MKKTVYLDNSATTEICPEALAKYGDVSQKHFGNPSSLHAIGFDAEGEMRAAREVILASVGGQKCQLIFTGSGTEANNLAILGRATSKDRYRRGMKIITTAGEHASVGEVCEHLRTLGHRVVYLPTRGGVIDFDALERELTEDVILLSIMMVNNETGAVYDLPRVAKTVKKRCPEALIHVDATQGYMKLPFTMNAIGADMLTVSAHKVEGPKGVGALIVRDEVIKARGIAPIIHGGGQQGGLRSGTENVPAIAAFGEAVRVGMPTLNEDVQYLSSLRALLIERLAGEELAEIRPTLPPRYAPHILNLTLPGIKSETMLHYLSSEGIYVSSGSACSSNSSHKSGALLAYGHTEREADCSIRVSFSKRNTPEDVHLLADALAAGLSRLARIK